MLKQLSIRLFCLVLSGPCLAIGLPHPHKTPPHPSVTTARTMAPIHVGSLTLHRCPDVAAYCGSVLRALDPSAQVPGNILIQFQLYTHTDTSQPPLEPIMAAEGGPGYSTSGSAAGYVGLFAPLMDRRDLLLIDERGTGKSQAVKCPYLQNGADEVKGIEECSAQMGDTRYLYGSGLAADDVVAILDALGYDRINLYGDSYGTFFSQTIAGRYPERLRSLVLDSAYPVRGLSPWYPEIAPTARYAFDVACQRSSTCSESPIPSMERIRQLVQSLREHPFSGSAPDGNGVIRNVEANAVNLDYLMVGNVTQSVVYRDLDAAARAYLGSGDGLPLLRLIAENQLTNTAAGEGNPADAFSEATFVAVSCQDYPQIYDMNSSLADRLVQRQQSFAHERLSDAWVYEPFSISEFDQVPLDTSVLDLCLHWDAPAFAPAYPPGEPVPATADFTTAPVLVMSGDLDSLTPAMQGAEAAKLFANARQIIVPNSFHVTADEDQDNCASIIVQRFVSTLDPGDTSCTQHIAEVHLVPAFAATASQLDPAVAQTGNQGTDTDLRVVAAAGYTVSDVIARWWVNYSGSDVGLRGGSFSYGGQTSVTHFKLDQVQWVNDLKVSGTASWDYDYPGAVSAHVHIEGPADDAGDLVFRWNSHIAHAQASITGTIGGRKIVATMYAP